MHRPWGRQYPVSQDNPVARASMYICQISLPFIFVRIHNQRCFITSPPIQDGTVSSKVFIVRTADEMLFNKMIGPPGHQYTSFVSIYLEVILIETVPAPVSLYHAVLHARCDTVEQEPTSASINTTLRLQRRRNPLSEFVCREPAIDKIHPLEVLYDTALRGKPKGTSRSSHGPANA